MYLVIMVEDFKYYKKNYVLRTIGVFDCFWSALNYLDHAKNNNKNNIYFIKEIEK